MAKLWVGAAFPLVLSMVSCAAPVALPGGAAGELSPEPLAAVTANVPQQRMQEERRGSFQALIGGRKLDDTVAWEQLDRPFVFGGEGEVRFEPPQFAAEFGALFGYDHTTAPALSGTADVDSYLFEFYGGPRFVFDLPDTPLTTYVGLGLTSLYADVSNYQGGLTITDYDWSLGFYIHGGVSVWVSPEVSVGVDLRSVTGTSVRLFGVGTDVDYLQLAGTVGFAF